MNLLGLESMWSISYCIVAIIHSLKHQGLFDKHSFIHVRHGIGLFLIFLFAYWGHDYNHCLSMCFFPDHILAIISTKRHSDIIYILLEISIVVSSYDRKICTIYSIICLTIKGFPLFPRLQRNFRIFRNLNMMASF